MGLEKGKESYITFLPRDECDDFSNHISKFEMGLVPFVECPICEERFFQIDEAKEHRKDIHPIAVADENHKPYSIRTCNSWTLSTFSCSKCGYKTKTPMKRCGGCKRIMVKTIVVN